MNRHSFIRLACMAILLVAAYSLIKGGFSYAYCSGLIAGMVIMGLIQSPNFQGFGRRLRWRIGKWLSIAAFTCLALPCSAQVNKTWVADTVSAAASVRVWSKEVGRDGKTRSIYFEHKGDRVAFTPLAVWLETATRMDAMPDSSGQIFRIVEAVMEGIAAQNRETERLKRKVAFQEQMLDNAAEDFRKLLLKIQRYESLFGVLKD